MYYNSYEEYMRDVLGYTKKRYNSIYNDYDNYFSDRSKSELENMYPEIYKIIYPMICKITSNQKTQLTSEQLDNMVNEIYENIEQDENDNRKGVEVKNNNKIKIQEKSKEKDDKRFRANNYILRDLIKILIIRELIGNKKTVIPTHENKNIPQYMPGNGMIRPPFQMRSNMIFQNQQGNYIDDIYY